MRFVFIEAVALRDQSNRVTMPSNIIFRPFIAIIVVIILSVTAISYEAMAAWEKTLSA